MVHKVVDSGFPHAVSVRGRPLLCADDLTKGKYVSWRYADKTARSFAPQRGSRLPLFREAAAMANTPDSHPLYRGMSAWHHLETFRGEFIHRGKPGIIYFDGASSVMKRLLDVYHDASGYDVLFEDRALVEELLDTYTNRIVSKLGVINLPTSARERAHSVNDVCLRALAGSKQGAYDHLEALARNGYGAALVYQPSEQSILNGISPNSIRVRPLGRGNDDVDFNGIDVFNDYVIYGFVSAVASKQKNSP